MFASPRYLNYLNFVLDALLYVLVLGEVNVDNPGFHFVFLLQLSGNGLQLAEGAAN